MINLTAYDTIACSHFVLNNILDKTKLAIISGELKVEEHASIRSDLAFSYYIIEGGNSTSDNIKFFNHPLQVVTGKKDDKGTYDKSLVLDARNYGSWHRQTESFVIRNVPGYSFDLNRLILNQLWYKEPPENLRDISHLPAQVYSTLISECLGKRFALNPREQAIISVLSSYFYCCLFTNDTKFDENEYNRILAYVSKVSRLPFTEVEEILNFVEYKTITDLNELCDQIKVATNSVALKDLNVGVLFSITTSTWFGNNAKETLAVSLEHIPTWLTIVYSSLEEASFKKSVISKISTRFIKNSEPFIKSFKTLVEGSKQF